MPSHATSPLQMPLVGSDELQILERENQKKREKQKKKGKPLGGGAGIWLTTCPAEPRPRGTCGAEPEGMAGARWAPSTGSFPILSVVSHPLVGSEMLPQKAPLSLMSGMVPWALCLPRRWGRRSESRSRVPKSFSVGSSPGGTCTEKPCRFGEYF